MGTFKQEAENYTSKAMKNISELESVEVNNAVLTDERTRSDGTSYTAQYVVINGDEYRIPSSVLVNLKEILKVKPKLKTFRVMRKGTTKEDTRYTIVPLD